MWSIFFTTIYIDCANFKSLSVAKHMYTHKTEKQRKKSSFQISTANPATFKSNLHDITISDLSWPYDYMVYSSVLIGSRCFSSVDWSNSMFSDSRVMEIKATCLLICFISEFLSCDAD